MAQRPTRAELTQGVMDRNLKNLFIENQVFRNFLYTLLVEAGIFYPAFTRGSSVDTAYEAGRQSLGLEVLHRLKNLGIEGVLGLLEREGDMFAQRAQQDADATPDFKPEDETDELP